MENADESKKRKLETTNESKQENEKSSYYDIYGPSAKPEIELKLPDKKTTLKIRDIQDLILWIIGEGVAPKWVFVKQKPRFSTYERVLKLPCPKTCQEEKLNKKKKKKLAAEKEAALPGPSHYILTEEDLENNNYPLLTQLDKSIDCDWISLPSPKEASSSIELVAVDCEMCSTKNGLELTRISVVDSKYNVLYDTFVLPPSPILDYHTKYSGITAEHLIDCKVSLKDVQSRLVELLHSEVILVGHSLENDLNALKLVHSKVIDTSILYPNQRGNNYKNALRYLSQRYLNTTIQSECHDSIIDASTAMKLTLLKIEKGPKFGGLNDEEHESLFKILEDSNNKCAMIDTPQLLKQYTSSNTSAIPISSDKEALDKLLPLSVNSNYHFVWCQFHELEELYNSTSLNEISSDSICNIIKKYDSYMNTIYQHLQKNTLLLSITGSGNMNSFKDLIQKKQKNASEWTPQDEELLESKVNSIRKGITFWCLKQ